MYMTSFNHSLTLECTIFVKCWQEEHNSKINWSILLSKLHSAKIKVIDNKNHCLLFSSIIPDFIKQPLQP